MKLRSYQKPMYAAAKKAMNDGVERSSYYASTGAGKTVIFMKLIDDLFKSDYVKRVLVVHPRIPLSTDQQERFVSHFNVPYTSFHSGSVVQSMENEDDTDFPRNTSVTCPKKLVKLLEATDDMDHIVFTSYKSLHKIADMHWDLIICDESHYAMEKATIKVLDKIKSQTMFFTATPIITEMEYSMDNIEKFGINDPDSNINPSTLIELGYNVLPRIYESHITTDESGLVEDYALTIGSVFKEQKAMLSEEIPHKMLVALGNTLRFDEINEQIVDIRSYAGTEVDVITIASGRNTWNGSSKGIKSRAKTLKKIAASKNDCIVIHCDTLSEGIDISGLTGAYIARGLGHAKFIQTVGRCIRPYYEDLVNDKPVPMSKRLKKFAPIHVAVVDGDHKNGNVEKWYNALLAAGYGAVVEDVWSVEELKEGITEESDEVSELGKASNVLSIHHNSIVNALADKYLKEAA